MGIGGGDVKPFDVESEGEYVDGLGEVGRISILTKLSDLEEKG